MSVEKDLINNLITILNNAITGGTLSANKVFKGLQNAPEQAATNDYPYIMIDEGGGTTDADTNPNSTRAQNRIYDIVFEMGTYNMVYETALDEILDLTDELKTIIESQTVRDMLTTLTLDGFVWGVEITPFGWDNEPYYFRGRQIIISFTQLEDTIDKY